MKNDIVKVIQWGLVCDNPSCDWRDDTIKFKEYKKWINAPCPKCGQNVLTEHDMENALKLNFAIQIVNLKNKLFGRKRKKGDIDVKVIANTHNDISFRIEE